MNAFNGNQQIMGAGGRYAWAAYSKKAGRVHWNDIEQTVPPTRAESAVLMYPFYIPEHDEVKYCEQLAEWWEGLGQKQKEDDERNSVVSISYRKGSRKHRLVEELEPPGPNTPYSEQYFNCTVEVGPLSRPHVQHKLIA